MVLVDASTVGLARLGAIGRRKLILGVVGEGSLGLRLELGSRGAAKGGVLRNLARCGSSHLSL